MAAQLAVRVPELPRSSAISFFAQIGPYLAQVTFGPMSIIGPIKKLIRKFSKVMGTLAALELGRKVLETLKILINFLGKNFYLQITFILR